MANVTYTNGDQFRDVVQGSYCCESDDDLELVSNTKRVQLTKVSTADSGGSAATDATTEVVIGTLPGPKGSNTIRTWRPVAARLAANAAVTAHDTNYATITFSCYTSAGATKTTIATITTKITGGTGDIAQFASKALTVSAVTVPAGAVITFEVAKASAGVALPIIAYNLTFEPL